MILYAKKKTGHDEQRCTNNEQQMNQTTALKVGRGKELKTLQTYKHYR